MAWSSPLPLELILPRWIRRLRTPNPPRGSRNDLKIERSRWWGSGSTDACGLSWAFDLVPDRDKVSGHLLWETVRYDLSGILAPTGSLQKAGAGKSPDFTGTPAPWPRGS